MRARRVCIIGGGIGGIATSILLAKSGLDVELFEQLDEFGGKARKLKAKGFTFDMGPSWYLMPGIFEHFYQIIGEDISKHLTLTRLSPAYKVFYEGQPPIVITGKLARDAQTFESIEPGSGKALKDYIEDAGTLYRTALDSFLYTNFDNLKPYLHFNILKQAPVMVPAALHPLHKKIRTKFNDQRLQQILEYPMVFLGNSPFDAPSLYSLMSYLDFEEGVYYPQGGMHTIIESLVSIAQQNGVKLYAGRGVEKILVQGNQATGIKFQDGKVVKADFVISNADLHFTETKLLGPQFQTYTEPYWQKRTTGPSALLVYLGIRGKLPQLEHHNLFFVNKWKENFESIFTYKNWPEPASMYICKPSSTDKTVAPAGHENIFVLVPVPGGAVTDKSIKLNTRRYLEQLKIILDEPKLEQRIVYKKIFGPNDFAAQYNSWQGSALGLNHTLRQSALFRPGNKSKKVKNLYYVGGNTLPGIGLPMCLISAELILKRLSGDTSNKPLEKLPELS